MIGTKQKIAIISIGVKIFAEWCLAIELKVNNHTTFEICITIAIIAYFMHLIFDDLIYILDEEEGDRDHDQD